MGFELFRLDTTDPRLAAFYASNLLNKLPAVGTSKGGLRGAVFQLALDPS
jgi:hypothetical protein